MDTKAMKNKTNHFAATCSSVISGVISAFLVIVVVALPLIYDNSYFNILETKYKCFYMSVLAMLAVILVLGLIMLVIDLIIQFEAELIMWVPFPKYIVQ